jgi:glycosyltransferase involved in cell wall biosynthesis
MKVLIVENLHPWEEIWWWQYLPTLKKGCELFAVKIPEQGFLGSIVPLLRLYLKLNNYDAVITHQDGYATFIFSFLNSLLKRKKCRHYVNEFITKEKSKGFYHYIKFLFLRFSFRSVYCIMCSSRLEIEYYKSILRLQKTKFRFVPLATNPKFIEVKSDFVGDYIISAGRTGRDYRTLLEAVKDLPLRLILVADYFNLSGIPISKNVEVKYNIPFNKLIGLIASAKFAVLPLQDLSISVGQSVLLEAMALGKAVIVTRNASTIDYITDGETGIFVSPGDSEDIKKAVILLLEDLQKAVQIGARAREVIQKNYLIRDKISRVCSIIKEPGALDDRPRSVERASGNGKADHGEIL